jgi:hypothetical protein
VILKNELQPYGFIDSRFYTVKALVNYTINNAGPWTTLGGCEGAAWVKQWIHNNYFKMYILKWRLGKNEVC